MKKFLCIFAFAAVMLSLFFVGRQMTKNELKNQVVLNNVEALTYGDLPGMWCAGATMCPVWEQTFFFEGTVTLFEDPTKGTVQRPGGWGTYTRFGWSKYDCCLISSYKSNSCNMADESSRCSQNMDIATPPCD